MGGMAWYSASLFRLPPPEPHAPQQLPHVRHLPQAVQREIPQQRQEKIHQRTERTIKAPMIIAAITGHLQYPLAMQESQEEKVAPTDLTEFITSVMIAVVYGEFDTLR